MDLETFFTTVYVRVDDWYKEEIAALKSKVGAPAQMSDMTLALVLHLFNPIKNPLKNLNKPFSYHLRTLLTIFLSQNRW
jgi:hypothetical protein